MMDNNTGDFNTLAHELGHSKYCLADEYQDIDASPGFKVQCFHSLMGFQSGVIDNHNFCVDHNHGGVMDPTADFPLVPSAMRQAFNAGAAVDFQDVTFDNTPYYTFDFHELLGKVYGP
jgi:hypothetical protein